MDEADKFLRKHTPVGEISLDNGLLLIAYENGSQPTKYKIAELLEFANSLPAPRPPQDVALHVMEYELVNHESGLEACGLCELRARRIR